MKNENEQVLIRVEGYIWDVKNVQLLAYVIKPEYETAGMWPADGIDVSEKISAEYTGQPPVGKKLGVGSDGLPAWVELPPPTAEEALSENERKKSNLRIAADAEINWRQDAVDVGIAIEEEAELLSEWKKYRVLLMRVNTAKPDWPTPPGEQAS